MDASTASRPHGAPPTDSGHCPILATAYAAALIELCARIWQDLEQFAEMLHQPGRIAAPPGFLWLTATLRLELVLMLDSWNSERWRSMLTLEQRATLRSMLTDVLDLMGVAADELTPPDIEQAQDRLLDEVLTQCSGLASRDTGHFGKH